MKNRFFIIILAVLFLFSCSHFVNLGDDETSTDNTAGLPDEMSEDVQNSDTADSSYNDWNEDSANSGAYEDDNTDAAPEGDWGNTGWDNGDSDIADTVDTADTADSADYTDSDYPEQGDTLPDSGSHFPESNPFPEDFSNADCDCGDEPDYDPICCNGVISVFNLCFAHCYAMNSGNKICTAYKEGLCVNHEEDDDDKLPDDGEETEDEDTDIEGNDNDSETLDDADDELSDSDEDAGIADEKCTCYPEDEPAIFSCGKGSYFISSCLAECLCADPERIFM